MALNKINFSKYFFIYQKEVLKIVAIPVSVFYQQAPESLRLIRFCFAKNDETLQKAGEILNQC